MKHMNSMLALAMAASLNLAAQDEPEITPSASQAAEAQAAAIEAQVEEVVNAVMPQVEKIVNAVSGVTARFGEEIEKASQNHLLLAQNHAREAHMEHPMPSHDAHAQVGFFDMMSGKPPKSRAVVVRTSAADEKEASALQEDITVMARILEKTLGSKAPHQQAMGIGVWALEGVMGRPARNLYIEDHGVIFMLDVNFPLLAPPDRSETPEVKDETSSAWEEAKHELYGDSRGGFARMSGGRNEAPYDAARVHGLRERIIDALRNATHIRELKDDSYVTVVVTGPTMTQAATIRSFEGKPGRNEENRGDRREPSMKGRVNTVVRSSSAASSTMTIRARKSDIDAFAQEKMDRQEFEKAVKIATY